MNTLAVSAFTISAYSLAMLHMVGPKGPVPGLVLAYSAIYLVVDFWGLDDADTHEG